MNSRPGRDSGVRRTAIVGASALAVIAALVSGVPTSASAATPANDSPQVRPASDPSALRGIEAAGPVPVTTGVSGTRWPVLPRGTAVMPSGSVLSGESPLVYVPTLRDVAQVEYRVIDLTSGRGTVVADGSLSQGWATIGATLAAGSAYAVEVRAQGREWSPAGEFTVAPPGQGSGPVTAAAGVSVSMVTGEASWSWGSRTLPGPVETDMSLSWSSGVPASPGLPEGWRLQAGIGSAWSTLTESGNRQVAIERPVAPEVSVKGNEATISVEYPAAEAALADGVIVQVRASGDRWRTVSKDAAFDGSETVTVKVPGVRTSSARVGIVTEGTVVWSEKSRVRSAAALPIEGAGRGSMITAGSLPASVRLTGWDGSTLTFVRSPLGVYEQAGGGSPGFINTLTNTGSGRWEFTDSAGVTTAFEGGRAVRVSDSGMPVATLAWDAQGRLTSMTNAVGRAVGFTYAGAGTCASTGWTGSGFTAPPAGMLCRITYPGGDVVDLGYVGAGSTPQIALIKEPGNAGPALAWDDRGRLVGQRSTLASRVAAWNDPAAATSVARVRYDSTGRVVELLSAAAAPGAAVASQTLTYPTVNDSVLRAWVRDGSVSNAVQATMVTTSGGYNLGGTYWLNPVTWQTVQARDRAGRQMSAAIDRRTGQMDSVRDASGRVTSYSYDDLGLVERTRGPVTAGSSDGMTMTQSYDTRRERGVDQPLNGLRAQVHAQTGFRGAVTGEFWQGDFSRGGLSGSWSGRPAEFSVQAAGVWTPDVESDARGHRRGWTFAVDSAPGTDVSLVVGSVPCVVTAGECTITDLPKGPKPVTVQSDRAGRSGWFEVRVAPAGERPTRVPASELSPGYALTSVTASNDVLPGSPNGGRTDYAYADPATGQATAVTAPGDLVTRMTYEGIAAASGRWARLLTRTTPGGSVQRTDYWPNTGSATLPGVCGGGSVEVSGQPRTVTMPDGRQVTSFYDITGAVRAVQTVAGSSQQVECTTYYADGTPRQTSTFVDGNLVERTDFDPAVGGDARVARVSTTNVSGQVVSSTVTIDLAGQATRSVDPSGVVTTAEFDVMGNTVSATVTPPAGAGAQPMTTAYTYVPTTGDVATARVNGVLAATVARSATTGLIESVTYADGTRSAYAYDPSGDLNRLTVTSDDARVTRVVDAQTSSAFGRIESATTTVTGTQAMTETRGYVYDSAGRLSRATITRGEARARFDYRYAARQDASCGVSYAAGLDNLRTGGSRNGVDYVTCHDAQGRLMSTTDPLVTGGSGTATARHDAFGRVTSLVSPSGSLGLGWVSGTTAASVRQSSSQGVVDIALSTFAGATYDKTTTIDGVSTTVRYGAPYVLAVTGGQVSGVSAIQYSLPGGALVSTAPGATAALTINGLDGAALVTVPVPSLGSGTAAAPGVTLGAAESYGPFGEPLGTPSALGDGVPRYGWQSGNGWETLPGPSSVTLLGARPYQPGLGEFLAPDPVLDSGSNAYGYTNGDPINTVDPDGNQSESVNWGAIAGAVAGVAAAFAGGFLAGRFTGVARAIGAVVGVAGVLGSAAATYIAASSELGTGAAVGVAVAAAAVSALTFFGGYRLGAYVSSAARVKKLKTVGWADALVDGNGAATLDDIKWTSGERKRIARQLARGQAIDSELLQPLGRGRSAGVGSVSVSSPVEAIQRIPEQLPVAPLRASADRAASVTSSLAAHSSGSVVDTQQLLNDYLKMFGR